MICPLVPCCSQVLLRYNDRLIYDVRFRIDNEVGEKKIYESDRMDKIWST